MTKSKKLSFYWTKIGQSETLVQKRTSFSEQLFDKTHVFCQKKAIEGSTNVFDWSDFFHSLLLHKTSLLLEIHWDCPQCLLVMDREEVLSLGGDGLEDELGVS